jgi:polysaccharide export outer membrane protein
MKPAIIFLALTLVSTALWAQDSKLPDQTKSLYIIQPNDALEIFVYKEPDLTRKVLVRPDGCISFPLVQDLQASGLNPGQLKAQVEKRLQDFLNAPNVTVIVDSIKSYQVYVVGKVQKPLAIAGGFQEYAKDAEISVISADNPKKKIDFFDYREVIKGRQLEKNVYLKSGDVVVVP